MYPRFPPLHALSSWLRIACLWGAISSHAPWLASAPFVLHINTLFKKKTGHQKKIFSLSYPQRAPTIQELRATFHQHCQGSFFLLYQGHRLNASYSLQEYGIASGTTLIAIVEDTQAPEKGPPSLGLASEKNHLLSFFLFYCAVSLLSIIGLSYSPIEGRPGEEKNLALEEEQEENEKERKKIPFPLAEKGKQGVLFSLDPAEPLQSLAQQEQVDPQ